MKRIAYSVLSLILTATLSQQALAQKFKQMMGDPSVNFYEVCKAAETYFETHDKNAKGSGWKGYQRWRNENESKYAPSGIRSNLDPMLEAHAFQNFKATSGSKNVRRLNENGWTDLGPYRIDSITGAYSAGLGRVIASFVDKSNTNTMYIGSRSGGFWGTKNGGISWYNSTDTLVASGVGTISASPTNSDSILIGVQNGSNNYSHGVYRSTNGGLNWVETAFNPTNLGKGGLGSNFRIYKIAYHPKVKNVIFVCASDGLYRSDDNLVTWTRVITGSVTAIDFHPTNSNKLYIYNTSSANRDKVLYSNDMGLSFTGSNTIAGNSGRTGYLSVSTDCANCIYFASTNGVWKSVDEGVNFTFLSNPPQSCLGFAVNDLDTSKMVYGYVDVETSEDGGRTFKQITWWSLGNGNHGSGNFKEKFDNGGHYIHADLHPALSINGVFYVGTDGLFCKSADNGETWEILSQGTGIRENYSLGASQSNHYRSVSGSQDNGTSIKHESTWIEFYGADGMEGIIHPLNDDWIMGSVQYGPRRRTKDGGQTQGSAQPSGQTGSGKAAWEAPLLYDPNNHMTIYHFSQHVYRSYDFGTTWDSVGDPIFSGTISEAAMAENNSNILLVSKGSNIEKSIDGGKTFTNIRNNLPNSTITDIAFDPADDNTFMVTYNRYQVDNSKIWITRDGGATWQNITHNLGNMPLRCAVVDHTPERNIYVGAEIGVYTKPMNGNTWTLYNQQLPNSTIRELEVVNASNTLRAAIWGRGLWENSLVGRSSYPAIIKTRITHMPTESTPKEGVDQYVSAEISYNGALNQVYVLWSKDTTDFDQRIEMSKLSGNQWKSSSPITNFPEGTKIYFKVYAVGSNLDTTVTYKFMYTNTKFEYCFAEGTTNTTNDYITSVSLNGMINITGKDQYTYYADSLIELLPNGTYELSIQLDGSFDSDLAGAWIDFNKNAIFDLNEEISMSAYDASHISKGTFTVPSDAKFNDTLRLRARNEFFGNTVSPCGSNAGEVEDYPVMVRALVNTRKIGAEGSLSAYPNPASQVLNVTGFKGVLTDYTIYNIAGKEVGQSVSSIHSHEGNCQLDISPLKTGIYLIKVGGTTIRFVKI